MISREVLLVLGLSTMIFGCAPETFTQGKRVYEAYCLQCHMADGQGLGELYPSLQSSTYLRDLKTELPCLIRNGRQSETLSTVYMPAHKSLKEAELSNLINYLVTTWGDDKVVQIKEVANQLNNCP